MRKAVAALGVVLLATTVLAADVSGDWEFTTKLFDDATYARVALTVDGERLSGTLNELTLEGTIKGDDVTFRGEYVWNDQGGVVHWTHDPRGWIRWKDFVYR